MLKNVRHNVVVGFSGTSMLDPGVKELKEKIDQGRILGVIFFKHNILNPQQFSELVKYLTNERKDVLLCVDQEGGRVQRLSSKNGYTDFLSAQELATLSKEERLVQHDKMSELLKDVGINCVFRLVVDLHSDKSTIIGQLGRSFSADEKVVSEIAEEVLDSCKKYGILCTAKHAPGHGLVEADSHKDLPDSTDIDNELKFKELYPYQVLAAKNKLNMIMTAHILDKNVDPDFPFTLSKVAINGFKEATHYDGLIVSDDLCMSAIIDNYSIERAIELTSEAGVHVLIISRNDAAMQGHNKLRITLDGLLEILDANVNETTHDEANEKIAELFGGIGIDYCMDSVQA
jgi:beta-N-acetylhexosaminidase